MDSSRRRGQVVAQERLGLFDTPPDRSEVRIGLAIVALTYIALLAAVPTYDFHVGQIPGFIPTTSAILLMCDTITAAILYAQAGVFRSRALTVLASGYLFSGLLFIPYALTYPGAFSPNGLLGAKLNTTGWIAVCWRVATPSAILLYALLKRADAAAGPVAERTPTRIPPGVLAAVALAGLVTLLTTVGHDLLPPFFVNHSEVIRSALVAVNIVVFSITIAALVALFRQEKSVLDLWLLVAMSAWLGQSLLNAFLHSRFSLGAYIFFALSFLSNLIVMLALITESNRLYGRLALSTAARRRERESRLMSMDAVTAAISHEVGQPLAAVGLNTSAAVAWLTGVKPDVKKALTALQAVSDARQRTSDIIKSVRATFAKEPGRASEFNLNDLVLETMSLLDRELAASKVSLQLSLDQALPPILADRVQMQRVLVNLFINAIESLRAISDRHRQIAIRTGLTDSKDVLLQVSDSGAGIASEDMEHVFDAFFTTKETGTGLGLPLCRSIVEDHGGRLWASQGEPYGANFHLRLPRSGGVKVSLSEDAHDVLSNLERSLSTLRQTSPGLSDAITELQHVADELRASLTTPKS